MLCAQLVFLAVGCGDRHGDACLEAETDQRNRAIMERVFEPVRHRHGHDVESYRIVGDDRKLDGGVFGLSDVRDEVLGFNAPHDAPSSLISIALDGERVRVRAFDVDSACAAAAATKLRLLVRLEPVASDPPAGVRSPGVMGCVPRSRQVGVCVVVDHPNGRKLVAGRDELMRRYVREGRGMVEHFAWAGAVDVIADLRNEIGVQASDGRAAVELLRFSTAYACASVAKERSGRYIGALLIAAISSASIPTLHSDEAEALIRELASQAGLSEAELATCRAGLWPRID